MPGVKEYFKCDALSSLTLLYTWLLLLGMASEHVLSIPRSDSEGDNVLLNVVPSGKAPLDLKLVATEGTSPYIIKSSRATEQLYSEQLINLTQSNSRMFQSIRPGTAP